MIDRSALVAHHKSKKHKQRVKQLKDAPWSQKGLGLMILNLVLSRGPGWVTMGKGRSQEWTITTEEQLVTKNTHD